MAVGPRPASGFGEHEHTWAADSVVRGVLDRLGRTGIGLDVPLSGPSDSVGHALRKARFR
jgi:hypothetical protein